MAWGVDSLNLWKVCPICGKKFIPASLHAWKDERDRSRLVCTYSCYPVSEKMVEEARLKRTRKRRKIK